MLTRAIFEGGTGREAKVECILFAIKDAALDLSIPLESFCKGFE